MWILIKNEFDYNQILFSSIMSIVLIISSLIVYQPIEDLPSGILMFWMMLLVCQFWVNFRHKENRDLQYARLPVSIGRIAASRILVIILISFSMIGLLILSQIILRHGTIIKWRGSFVAFGIIIFIFSSYFVLRDLFLYFLRNNSIFPISKDTAILLLVFLALILNILGIFAFYRAQKGELKIFKIFDFFRFNPLFNTVGGIVQFIILWGLMSVLSIFTYGWRKSYLE